MTDRIPDLAECRPEVLAFARLMECELRENDHKGGWAGCAPESLLRRLREETDEVERELTGPRETCGCREAMCPHVVPWFGPDPKRVGAEAADVGNFAMMVADVTGALKQVTTERVLTLEMVENQVREVLDDEIGWWLGERYREELVGMIIAGLRQQMGGLDHD